MTNKRIVLSSDHAAIDMRQTIADHIAGLGYEVVDGLAHANGRVIRGKHNAFVGHGRFAFCSRLDA